MLKRKILKLVAWFKESTPTTQGLIILGVLLVVGIILRWIYIVSEIMRGFGFFSVKERIIDNINNIKFKLQWLSKEQ